MSNSITYSNELLRKIIHIASSLIAFLLYFLSKEQIIYPLIIITLLFLILDITRFKTNLNLFYLKYFKSITRFEERNNSLTGASYVFIGITLTVIFFDSKIAIPAILILSLADSASALIGRKYGAIYINNKTLEGSIAFYLTTVLILIFFNFNILYILIIAIILVFVEYFDKLLIDDNIALPIISSILIQIFLI